MNARDCAIVQKLIANLDDSRLLYLTLKPLLDDSHARFLVSRMIDLHSATADDLAQQVRSRAGIQARRGGSVWVRLRAQAAWLIAMAGAGREAACLKRIARHEDRVTQRFQLVMARVRDLHPNLQRQLLTLERTGFRIELLAREQQTASQEAPYTAMVTANLTARDRSRR